MNRPRLKPKRLFRAAKRPLLITGATGTLGQAFQRIANGRGLKCCLSNRQELDITKPENILSVLNTLKPWAIINAAGYVRVDKAESHPDVCYRENTYGPANLAQACQEHNISFVTFSTDLVFDGTKHEPYVESDALAPLNVYGQSKAEAEKMVLAVNSAALVARTSAFFGPWDQHNFVTQILQNVRDGKPVQVPHDVIVSPTYIPDLVNVCLDLLIDGESGIWHLANRGQISWAELARRITEIDKRPKELIIPKPLASFQFPARRPVFSALTSERGNCCPIWKTLWGVSSQNYQKVHHRTNVPGLPGYEQPAKRPANAINTINCFIFLLFVWDVNRPSVEVASDRSLLE